MDLPVSKNKSWMAGVLAGIARLPQPEQAAIMKPAGMACAGDILALCEKESGRKIEIVDDLVTGWNLLRERRNLTGKWVVHGNIIRGVFNECGCPLVRSGLIELHPVQCHCSQGMMETIFSRVLGRPVDVKIQRSIGRGDAACEFVIQL